MTRAVVATAFGGPEVLALAEVELASPAPDEISVDIRAAGVNPVDAKLYSGMMGTAMPLPMRLGMEAAGVVTAAGAAAVGPRGPISVGDEVIVYRVAGAYADQLVVPASAAVPKPAAMSWEAAAGLMLAGSTAVHALTVTGVDASTTLLVHGAAGGVGLMAVQVALGRGARVIGTASPARHDVLRALGVEPVAYGPGLADRVRALAPNGIDAAIDTVGTDEAIDVSLELVPDRARIVTIAGFARGLQEGIKAIGGVPGADPGTDIRMNARLELVDLVAAGGLAVTVAAAYPLAEAAAAHRAILSGHTSGKIVLVP